MLTHDEEERLIRVMDGIVAQAVMGYVTGPASAINSNLVAFDQTTGKLVKDSGASVSDLKRFFIAMSTSYGCGIRVV